MNRGEIYQRVRKILADVSGTREGVITLDKSLEDFGLDSLNSLELLTDLEEEFNLTIIPEEELNKMQTVEGVVTYIDTNAEEHNKSSGTSILKRKSTNKNERTQKAQNSCSI